MTGSITYLEALRRSFYLSRRELAERTGVSVETVQQIERGLQTQGPAAQRIAEYLGVDVTRLAKDRTAMATRATGHRQRRRAPVDETREGAAA